MRKLHSILALASASLFLVSCIEENLEQIEPARDGDEVIFSAVSGFETSNVDTRTVYSGATYKVGEKTYERVEWEDGDKIKIYCNTADNNQSANYSVEVTEANADKQIHTASLNKHEGNNGIQWSGSGEHTFYAIYPSPDMPDQVSSETTLKDKVDLIFEDSAAKIKGYVPTTQAPIGYENNKEFTLDGEQKRTATKWAKPDMRYSYMVAAATSAPNKNGVNLSFSAISTAVEIDLIAQDDVIIKDVTLLSSSAPISGEFTCPINPDGSVDSDNIVITNGATQVTITMGTGVALDKGESLRITALLLPVKVDAGDLSIKISTSKTATGVLSGVSIAPHKKYYLTNLTLQREVEIQGNNWIESLPNNTLLKGLSIPGSANSFSYNYNSASNKQYYQTQTQNFETQWNLGVRCFEIVTDRTYSGSILNEPIYCNNTSVDLDVSGAFDLILDKLTSNFGKDEFAMVILTYQPRGNNPGRDGAEFMECVTHFYDNYKYDGKTLKELDIVRLYEPGQTLGNVRGKLMIVARPSQEGEESIGAVEAAVPETGYPILTVKGWGSLTDKWWKRGYDYQIFRNDYNRTEYPLDSLSLGTTTTTEYNNKPYVEAYIFDKEGTASPTRTAGSQRFVYASDQGYYVWAQEWRRVSSEDREFTTTNIWGTTTTEARWFESYSLKKEDVLHTFEKSISDKTDTYVYFNSLDGFYIIDDRDSYGAYYRGNMGDIASYADDINADFYRHILTVGEKNITGSMGVVIMDYVGDGTPIDVTLDDGSQMKQIPGNELPGAVLRNNFKFPLPTSSQQ